MEHPVEVAENFAPSFSFNFSSIFVHIKGSIGLITLIWASLERSFPPAEVEYKLTILVKSDDVRRGRKAKVRHGWLQAAQASMG